MNLRQRSPRLVDSGYLEWLRKQRCCCGCLQAPPCDAAHVRATSLQHGKRNAFGKRPDDCWALPLKHEHHMHQHQRGELSWWRERKLDPFVLCLEHYQRYLKERGQR